MRYFKQLIYRLSRWFISILARPRLTGVERVDAEAVINNFVYVLDNRSLSDLIIVDLICEKFSLPSPLESISIGDHAEDHRFFFLNRASGGWFRRNSMQTYSDRFVRILENATEDSDVLLLPVAVFWGRAPQKEGSLFRDMFSENWAVTPRLKRMVNLLFSRHYIVVNCGTPIPLRELARIDPNRVTRRAARLLRVRLRNQRVATLGPDFSHQRTLINQILNSRAVQQALSSQPGDPLKLERQARKAAFSIVSNMSYPTIRMFHRLLTWFWQEIYNGVEVHGIQRLHQIAESHTIVYLPSHRSHVDYLLLSYLLFESGLMIPHVAAGDNLNLPLVGPLLRRGGGFFMRRSFRDDPIYAAVFSEYLYQVYRRGHCVEFFPEGGRSRTGRLLPARLGMLKMTIDDDQRGIPRPLALMPVYFGYEKLVEASSYLSELRGTTKRGESIADVVRNLKLLRQNFGKVDVNFGQPILLQQWLADHPQNNSPADLGHEILLRINAVASVNPVNLVALVTLSTPRLAIDESLLINQINCYLALLRADETHHDYSITKLDGDQVVRYVEDLGMLKREHQEFGDVLCHDADNAVLMTWYRNNISHTLALPSLIASLLYPRRRPLNRLALTSMIETVFPYIGAELNVQIQPSDIDRWLKHLIDQGLLTLHPTGGYTAPSVSDANNYRLSLLTSVVTPTLERFYIVISLLARSAAKSQTRDSLQTQSKKVAHKMGRIYGLNAPEFFDARLFDLFIEKLIENKVVTEAADGSLSYSQLLDEVLKAAGTIINPEFRYAIQREP